MQAGQEYYDPQSPEGKGLEGSMDSTRPRETREAILMMDTQVADCIADGVGAFERRLSVAIIGGNPVVTLESFDGKAPAEVLYQSEGWYIVNKSHTNIWNRHLALQTTCIAHQCEHFNDAHQFLDEVDALQGKCWWCKEKIPEKIQTLWRLMNADTIPEMMQRFEGECS